MAITLVQQANSKTLASAAPTCAFGSNVVAGNEILVGIIFVSSSGLPTISSVTDTLGNTYKAADRSSVKQEQIYYAENIVGGANTVTINFSGSTTEVIIFVLEISKPALTNSLEVDWVRGSAGGGSTSVASSPFTTIYASEFLFALARTDIPGEIFTAGGGMTLLNAAPGTSNFSGIGEYRILSSKVTGVTAGISYIDGSASEIMASTFYEAIPSSTGSPVSAAIV